MGKNKYRLTKQKREYGIISKKYVKGEVFLYCENDVECKNNEIIDNYVNVVGLNQRFKSYLRDINVKEIKTTTNKNVFTDKGNRGNTAGINDVLMNVDYESMKLTNKALENNTVEENEKLLEKNKNKFKKMVKGDKPEKKMGIRMMYEGSIVNDIPLSLGYFKKPDEDNINKRKVALDLKVENTKNEIDKKELEKNYNKFCEKLDKYNNEKEYGYGYYFTILKAINEKLYNSVKAEKTCFQKEILGFTYQIFKESFRNYRDKSAEEVKFVDFKTLLSDNSFYKIKCFKSFFSFYKNRLLMNLIDVGKVYYEMDNKLPIDENLNSELLESSRVLERFYKKVAESIVRANSNVTQSDELIVYVKKDQKATSDKSSEKIITSFDLFGSNTAISKINEVKEKMTKAGYNFNEHDFYGLYVKLCESFNFDSKDYSLKTLENLEIIIYHIIELRSAVIHKQKIDFKNFKKINFLASEYEMDLKKYKKAIINKYISNGVNQVYETSEYENVLDKVLENNVYVMEKNFMPKFSKIIDKLKWHEKLVNKNFEFSIKYYKPLEDDITLISRNFILKEIYYSFFKETIQSKQNNVLPKFLKVFDMYNLIIYGYYKNVKHITKTPFLTFNFNGNTYSDIFQSIDPNLAKGNFDEIIGIWNIFILSEFDDYVKKNFEYLLDVKGKLLTPEKLSFKDFEKGEIYSMIESLEYTIYALSKLLTRREINELKNAFVSLYQFSYAKKYEKITNIFSNDSILQIIRTLSMISEITQIEEDAQDFRKDDISLKNKKKSINNDKIFECIKVLLKNEEQIENYTQEDNLSIIQFKGLRLVNEDNTAKLFKIMFENIILEEYFKDDSLAILDRIKFREKLAMLNGVINDDYIKIKEKFKEYVKNKSIYKNIEINEALIDNWNKRNLLNFKRNMVTLHTPLKLHKFVVEILGLLIRTVESIERDMVYSYSAYSEITGAVNCSEYNKLIKKQDFKEFCEYFGVTLYLGTLRDEIAHFNYFNLYQYEKSLKDLVILLHNELNYNKKRKKAFRLAVEYIFEKNCLNFKFKDGTIAAMNHEFFERFPEYKGATSFKKLNKICSEEKDLFEYAYNFKKGDQNGK